MNEWLKLHNVSYTVEGETILENVNLSVKQGDVVGLIGKNGAGKSTLLRMLKGDLLPTKGDLSEVVSGLQVYLVEQFTEKKGEFQHLSGGEKRKISLSKGFSNNADILLLDEPTNHLDEKALQVLMDQIKKYEGTVIIVSHDRFFLDQITKTIWSIEDKRIREYKGNYSDFAHQRKQERQAQARAYEKQQKKIARMEGQMNELTNWSHKAHAQSTKQEGYKEYYRVKAKRMDAQVKSKRKRLENELAKESVDRLQADYEVSFAFSANNKVGKRFLQVTNVAKRFGERVLFENLNETVKYGEKIGIVGPNGSGKTTLLRGILGNEEMDGDIWISPAAKIGYISQEITDLPLDKTPAEWFYQESYEKKGKVQNMMKHLGFSARQWEEPFGEMSMGERMKCKLMEHLLDEKDVLVLDEPTNHLDLESREQLEETLEQYTGTLLIVSHDRYFMDKVTTEKWLLQDGRIVKQSTLEIASVDDVQERKMRLETERQEVLGKLSFAAPGSQEYQALDKRFSELMEELKGLSL
ncbi:ribosomal protection-like ABC-F family protein [Mangrovibacillus cuniculi]|uniref:ABC-F family ATP-binding cassette domain-containing protein n=1 Tax=Mangrovibacillus cuniculi TaxID=2593652 RepID=A0A7S8HEC1_9BACI|nr:ABC-F family ATP-binding cassette domain-containing protein [Mangrovibacillus cuniculi]QPC45562.1 ABC-F family ATP-binding cassette domain-containing protein [Mangrovibacillus cuniculi]